MGKNNKGAGAKGGAALTTNPVVKPPRPSKSRGNSQSKVIYAAAAILVAAVAAGLQQAGILPFGAQPVPEPPLETTTAAYVKSLADKAVNQAKKSKARRSASPSVPAPRRPTDPSCVDDDESCEQWAKAGECDRNEAFMHSKCRASCHICASNKPKPKKANACEDSNANCATWAAIGECHSNPGFMLTQCPVTCKMCQSETCFDALDDCAARCKGGAASNFSETLNCYYEPELVEKCAWTCGACKEHRFDRPDCARNPGGRQPEPPIKPGGVNQIFQRIADEQPGTTVLSSPHTDGPWVLTIDDFLSDEECDAVREAGSESGSGWARSQAGDGVQSARTSSTAWCKGRCLSNSAVQAVEKRVSDLMGGIPMDHAEPMQVLRYETGQFYKVHHDQNSPRSSAWGPRMFTVFMYIGDGYTGGETAFPRLNLTVQAKKGRAAVWTSVLDSDPWQRDDRTDHESLPVESGIKYGVNYCKSAATDASPQPPPPPYPHTPHPRHVPSHASPDSTCSSAARPRLAGIHMFPFRSKSGGRCGNEAYIQNWY